MTMKLCKTCEIEKPVEDFYMSGPKYRSSYCKQCSHVRCNKYAKERYQEDEDYCNKIRARNRAYNHGRGPTKKNISSETSISASYTSATG